MLRMDWQGQIHAKFLAGRCVRAAADASLTGVYADRTADAGVGYWRYHRHLFSHTYGDDEVDAGGGSGDAVSRGGGKRLLREHGAGGELGAVSLCGVPAVPGCGAGV